MDSLRKWTAQRRYSCQLGTCHMRWIRLFALTQCQQCSFDTRQSQCWRLYSVLQRTHCQEPKRKSVTFDERTGATRGAGGVARQGAFASAACHTACGARERIRGRPVRTRNAASKTSSGIGVATWYDVYNRPHKVFISYAVGRQAL